MGSAIVIAGLLPTVMDLFACWEHSKPLSRVYSQRAGTGGSGNRLNGDFTPSRSSAWPVAPVTKPFVRGSAVTPSRPPTAPGTTALPGPGRGCRTPENAASWPVSGPSPWTLQDRFSPPALGHMVPKGTALNGTSLTFSPRGEDR